MTTYSATPASKPDFRAIIGSPIQGKEDPMENREELKRSYKTASMIGVAIIAGLFVYLIVVEVLRTQLKPFRGFAPIPEMKTFRYIFYGLAVLEVLIIRLVQSLLLKRAPGDTAKIAVQKLFRTSILTVCLSEVPAILGLVLFLIGGLNKDFYALLAVSLVLVFMYFPRLASWQDWIARNT
jgi:F0F1-type ATP synthase membrane subunit c/vacuolar-type H+-ATPase subunit K